MDQYLTWSPAEKKAARKAFEAALGREFDVVIRKTKQRAARIKGPEDLWDLEAFLTDSRKRIDRDYDYRYSALPQVFANLIFNGRLKEEELGNLRQDKLELIGRLLRFARRPSD